MKGIAFATMFVATAVNADMVLSNACARLAFDSAGCIVSAVENGSERELLAAPTPFVGVSVP